MPPALSVHVEALAIYDGVTQRCRLDGASVRFDYGVGGVQTETTDADGLLSGPQTVTAKHSSCLVKVSRDGYATVAVRAAVGWGSFDGYLKLAAVYLQPD